MTTICPTCKTALKISGTIDEVECPVCKTVFLWKVESEKDKSGENINEKM